MTEKAIDRGIDGDDSLKTIALEQLTKKGKATNLAQAAKNLCKLVPSSADMYTPEVCGYYSNRIEYVIGKIEEANYKLQRFTKEYGEPESQKPSPEAAFSFLSDVASLQIRNSDLANARAHGTLFLLKTAGVPIRLLDDHSSDIPMIKREKPRKDEEVISLSGIKRWAIGRKKVDFNQLGIPDSTIWADLGYGLESIDLADPIQELKNKKSILDLEDKTVEEFTDDIEQIGRLREQVSAGGARGKMAKLLLRKVVLPRTKQSTCEILGIPSGLIDMQLYPDEASQEKVIRQKNAVSACFTALE